MNCEEHKLEGLNSKHNMSMIKGQHESYKNEQHEICSRQCEIAKSEQQEGMNVDKDDGISRQKENISHKIEEHSYNIDHTRHEKEVIEHDQFEKRKRLQQESMIHDQLEFATTKPGQPINAEQVLSDIGAPSASVNYQWMVSTDTSTMTTDVKLEQQTGEAAQTEAMTENRIDDSGNVLAASTSHSTVDSQQNIFSTGQVIDPALVSDSTTELLSAQPITEIMTSQTTQDCNEMTEDSEEIVITITDEGELDASFDETAESIALSCLNLSGSSGYYYSTNSSVVTNTDDNLEGYAGINYPNTNTCENTLLQVVKENTNTALVSGENGVAIAGAGFALSNSVYGDRSTALPVGSGGQNTIEEQGATCNAMYGAEFRKDQCFDKEYDRWSGSSLDQCVPHPAVNDLPEFEADLEEFPALPVLLDEDGNYDSEPIPYQTYTDKKGNNFFYNPKTGHFEPEIVGPIQVIDQSIDNSEVISSSLVAFERSKNSDETTSPGSNTTAVTVSDVAERGLKPVDEHELFVRLSDDKNIRQKMAVAMYCGKFGKNPHVVRVEENGCVSDISNLFREYLPKKVPRKTKSLPEH